MVMKFCIHIDVPHEIVKSHLKLFFAEVQILKKMRLLQNDIYHQSRFCRAPNSEKVKMALSLELSGIL